MAHANTKLYLVHAGFYDLDLLEGVFEQHINFFVVAESFEEARLKAKIHPDFKNRKMHVDGLQEIEAVDGHRVQLIVDDALAGKSKLTSNRHRDLAPKSTL